MTRPPHIDPIAGDWYQSHGRQFEVVAIDDDIIQIQHVDGDLEEMDIEDWATRCRAGSLQQAEPPEDSRVADDSHDEDSIQNGSVMDELHGMHASPLEGLDLFE